MINLGEGDRVIDMTRVPKSDDEPEVDEAVSEEGEGAADGASEGAAEDAQTSSEESE